MLAKWKQAVEIQNNLKDFKLLEDMWMTEVSHPCQSFIAASPIQLLSVCSPLLQVCHDGSKTRILSLTLIGIFLISIYGVQVRGVATPNVLVGVLIFFGGVCQFISGIMEFVSGNTVSRINYL